MHRLKCSLQFVSAIFCALVLLGCGDDGAVSYDTQFVEGIVTLDGNPVAGATVTFVPINEGQGVSATGTTDESGKYTLTTVGGGVTGEAEAGTVAGEYYVGVVKTELPAYPESHEEAEVFLKNSKDSAGKPSKVTYIVPQKFNNPRDSGVKVTVKDGENDIPIPLTTR